jgi:hypothetical protein
MESTKWISGIAVLFMGMVESEGCVNKAVITATALIVSWPAFSQGTIQFNNRMTGLIDAPVTRCDGTGAGAGVTAQLFLVSGSGPSTTYIALAPATTFRTMRPEVTYYVNEPLDYVRVPGVQYGEEAVIVMRAWEGSTYETATIRGQSLPITVEVGPPAPIEFIPAGRLIGLEGFSLCIPEPSTIAVFILGVAGLFVGPRRIQG